MFKTYTNHGRAWEIANSWWVLLTFAPFGIASFLSFLYIGFQVKHRRWQIWGIVYLGAFITAFALNETSAGLSAAIAVALWIVSVVHAFRIRPAFLVQLDVYKANEKVRNQQKNSQLRQEAEAKFQSAGSTTQFKPPVPKKKAEADQPERAGNEEQDAEHLGKTDGPAADAPATTLNQTGNGRRIDY